MELTTLTEFLLARIDEDERLVAEYPGLTPDFPPKWELGLYYEDDIAMALTISADRVRAECQAKRRILEEIQRWGSTTNYINVLILLALPYADHPDYDETWRP